MFVERAGACPADARVQLQRRAAGVVSAVGALRGCVSCNDSLGRARWPLPGADREVRHEPLAEGQEPLALIERPRADIEGVDIE